MNRDGVVKQWACSLTLIVLFPCISTFGAAPPPTVAMAGIAVEGLGAGAATGAAVEDLLWLALQDRGLPILERQSLRYVLSERDIQSALGDSGLATVRRRLPHARFLVTGRLSLDSLGAGFLRIALTDVRSGAETATYEEGITSSKGLSRAVTILAERIAVKVVESLPAGVPRNRPFGFTRLPEVALTYFRGVESTLAGRPEMGVAWFREAIEEDDQFLVARLWMSRAYEMLGLPDVADAIRDEMRATPSGERLLALLDSGAMRHKGVLSVALAPSPFLSHDVVSAIRSSLQEHASIRVFAPAAIPALATESDLDLSACMDPSDLMNGFAWYMVDATLRIEEGKKASGVDLILLDTMTGTSLFRETVDPRQGKAIAQAIQRMCAAMEQRTPAIQPQALPSPEPPAEATNTTVSAQEAKVRRFADRVKRAAGPPPDAPGLMELADDHSGRVQAALLERAMACVPTNNGELLVRLAGRFDPASPHRAALLERAMAAVDRGSSNAPSVYMRALRLYDGEHRKQALMKCPGLIADACRSDFECKMALYETGVDFYLSNDWDTAFRFLGPVADSIAATYGDTMMRFCAVKEGRKASGLHDMEWFFDLEASLYFFAASSAAKAGQKEAARRYADMAHPLIAGIGEFGRAAYAIRRPDAVLPHTIMARSRGGYTGTMPWIAGGLITLEGQTIDLAHLEAVFQPQVIGASSAVPAAPSNLPPPVVQEASALSSKGQPIPATCLRADEFDDRVRMLYEEKYAAAEALARAVESGTLLSSAELEAGAAIFNWAMFWAASREEGQYIRDLANRIAPRLHWRARVRLLAAVGEYNQAKAALDEVIGTEAPECTTTDGKVPVDPAHAAVQVAAIRVKGDLIRFIEGPGAHARYLEAYRGSAAVTSNEMADAYLAAGNFPKAKAIYAQRQTTTDLFLLARLEMMDGNQLEASRYLKQLADLMTGKPRGDVLRILSRMRLYKGLKVPTPGGGWASGWFGSMALIRGRTWEAMEAEVRLAYLRRDIVAPSVYHPAFLMKYQEKCVPVILSLVIQNPEREPRWSWAFVANELDAVATPRDAPAIIEMMTRGLPVRSFLPFGWAQVAIKVDRLRTIEALCELLAPKLDRAGIWAEADSPRPWGDFILTHRIRELYNLVLLSADEPGADESSRLIEFDKLADDASPDIQENYAQVLEEYVDRLAVARAHTLAPLSRIAVRRGVAAGIGGLLTCAGLPSDSPAYCSRQSAVDFVRPYAELPDDEERAAALLKTNLGRWEWDPRLRKYTTVKRTAPP